MKYMAERTIVLLALFSLPPALIAAGSETRGTLTAIHGRQTLELRDEAGQDRVFHLEVTTPCYRGTRHQIAVDFSQLQPGAPIRIQHEGNNVLAIYEEWRWYEYAGLWLDERIDDLAAASNSMFGASGLLSTRIAAVGLVSILVVATICGLVSSLVVTNRMAFFSDALAHCAFAGVALGWILRIAGATSSDAGILGTMVLFGVLVGIAIAFVREQTSLSNDTVIGVFFAGAMGLGAVLLTGIGSTGSRFSPENFVFGDPQGASGQDLAYLLLLGLAIAAVFGFLFNGLLFASFNPSLARSRNFPVRLGNYVFVILLGLTVNLCLKTTGALLISALLVLPAASATNLARNLRQFFWIAVAFSLLPAVCGWLICQTWVIRYEGREIHFGPGGMIVVVGVIIFFTSMALSRSVRGQRAAARTSF
jgi:zinc transport system permease protein